VREDRDFRHRLDGFALTEGIEKPAAWIIQADHWPRAYLRAELLERGYDVVGFEHLQEALAALRLGIHEKPFVLLLDLKKSSLEAGEISALSLTPIPKILLVGAVELNEPWIERIGGGLIMRRPFTIGELADLVETVWRGL
jgi:hypothetical protein